MKKFFFAVLVTFALSAFTSSPALARFTGVIDMNLNMPNGSSAITYFLGDTAQRMDMATKLDNIPDILNTSVITFASQPDEALVINHKAGAYSKVNLKTAAENATLVDFDSDYSIEKADTVNFKGYLCQHVRLSSSSDSLEMWLTKNIGDFQMFRLLQSQNPRLSNTLLAKKLADENIDGFPVKIIQHNETGTLSMEIVSVQQSRLESHEFKVPGGYREVTDTAQPLEKQQKEHLKELMEKMKNFEE